LDEKEFETLLAGVKTGLEAGFGAAGTPRGRDASSAVRAEGLVWQGGTALRELEWSVTRASAARNIPFRAEFIRLSLAPPGDRTPRVGATPPASPKAALRAFRGEEHVGKGPEGEVWIGSVPMVDQGQKGYCVVASVERVLRYYGADVDQHELAQIANTATEGGTSPDAMMESLRKLTMRMGVKAREVVSFEAAEFFGMIKDYNREAKRAKLPEVDLGGRVVDISACYQQMKPEILREVRTKTPADFGRFQREIRRSIDAGIPLLWSVQLGLVPEAGLSQARGGHMRLIIGYDPASGDLFYSDSWGIGHERKRMPAADAWTITTALATVQPTST
jgi:hypothetical protein